MIKSTAESICILLRTKGYNAYLRQVRADEGVYSVMVETITGIPIMVIHRDTTIGELECWL